MVVTRLNITGMTCVRCSNRVKTALEGVRGVRAAQVDWQRGFALVRHADDMPVGTLEEAVAGASESTPHRYSARLAQDDTTSDRAAWVVAATAFLLCAPCLLALVAVAGGAGAAAARLAGLSLGIVAGAAVLVAFIAWRLRNRT